MASHSVAIAKASFAAALLRPDPASTSRDEINRFHTLLEEAVNKCTPTNVQNCINWLSGNVVPSTGRATALGKYLAALSTSYGKAATNGAAHDEITGSERAVVKRKRLHILYVLHDLLHHAKYHTGNTSAHATLSSALQPQLVNIFTTAASFERSQNIRHHGKLDDLLDIWAQHGYYSEQYVDKLRETVRNSSGSDPVGGENAVDQSTRDISDQSKKDAPFSMPATHGDPSLPYYDLPAGNMMPHIIPNHSTPINPQLVKPLQFVAGPADQTLVTVVKDFLKDVEVIYGGGSVAVDEGIVADIDEMGQSLSKDEMTGELVATEGYYGWSIAFCERMKKRRRDGFQMEQDTRRHGRGRSRSRSGSSTPRKKRRLSSSGSRGGGAARYRSYSRSRSSSRQRTSRLGNGPQGIRHRDSRSSSRSRSSPARGLQTQHDTSRPLSPSRALLYPQVHHLVAPHLPNAAFITPADQIDNPFHATIPPPPIAPPHSHYQHNFPVGPGGLPIPPPPPFHTGPWPPPPVAPPHNYNQHNFPLGPTGFPVPPPPPYHSGAWPPPPPPPSAGPTWPVPGQGRGQGQWGQGNGDRGGGGGGWRGRGRGEWRR